MAEQLRDEKWAIIFLLMDINHDGTVSSKDKDACRDSFQAVFKLEGSQLDDMMKHVDKFWDHALFPNGSPDWSQSYSKDEFFANRRKLYEADKQGMMASVKTAMENLCMAADINGTKSFTFEEFQKLHKAFNITNEDLIKGVHSMVSPDASGCCAMGNVVDFYTELTMGDDKDKHEICKAAFSAAGLL